MTTSAAKIRIAGIDSDLIDRLHDKTEREIVRGKKARFVISRIQQDAIATAQGRPAGASVDCGPLITALFPALRRRQLAAANVR